MRNRSINESIQTFLCIKIRQNIIRETKAVLNSSRRYIDLNRLNLSKTWECWSVESKLSFDNNYYNFKRAYIGWTSRLEDWSKLCGS